MNEDFRRTAPAPLAPVPFNVPQLFETTLENGLKVVVVQNKKLPLVSFRLAFRSGQINDPQDSIGLASALAQMLNEGTATRSSKELAEAIEKIGASLNANSSSDNTIISASALSMYASDILNLMADMTLNPVFPEKELALYKQNTIEGLKVQRADAGFLAHERISKIIYGSHPYSITSPTPDNIEKISRDKLVDFHKKTFVPNNATLFAVGDVEPDKLIAELNELFGKWEPGNIEEKQLPVLPERTEKSLTIVDRPGSAQSNIILSNAAINRKNPDYFPVLVMNQILGAGASSRLFMNLREEKGYTYGAYSSFDMRRRAGAFEASAEVRTPVTGDALKEFFYELERIRDEEVSAKELQDAKNYLTGVFPIRAETLEGLTNLIVTQQLYDLPADYLLSYRDNINAVTLSEVQRVAKTYLMPEKLAIVVVGDAEEILKQVKSYAEKIEIYDTEGNQMDISNYGKESEAPTVDVTGKWILNLEVQGQKLPVTLDLKQDGEKVTGSLDTMLGKGNIENCKISGNKINALVSSDIQGQSVELNLSGTVEGDKVSGIINISIPGFPPANFEGNRQS
jgi:zinc protease